MSLILKYEKDLDAGSQPFIAHEPDSILYNYYIDEERAMDKNTDINAGDYTDVTFNNEERHLTTKAITRIGVKNFPGIGGIGYYKDAYSDECLIAAPIHAKRELIGVPMLKTVEVVGDKLHIVIDSPDNVDYNCYRVIVRQKAFAFEYILYKTDYFVDLPTVKGDYICFCFGYDEDNDKISENSNELSLTIETGSDTWAP